MLAHNITVEATFNDLRKISVRPGEMVQVFSNVISNAIDAMPDGGRLLITTTRTLKEEQDGLRIVVSDTGHGIRRENIARVFEPFFTTKGNLGTGIGLWVARQLVERHGGQISISSSTERGDSGTVVTIYLPFSRSQSTVTNGHGSESREVA
jgi:signal transduction histidine kinase